VQGLVIGSVVGRVIHALLSMSDCNGSFFGVSMVATLGLFTMVSFYLFMSSETFGFTAYLFGGFGSMVILGECSDTENTEAAYLAITGATICIIIMAGVDLALAPSAADDAAQAYFGFLRSERDAVISLLDHASLPADHDTRTLASDLDDTIRSAQEAAKAPSMVRKPFRLELFQALVSTSRQSLISFDTFSKAVRSEPDARNSDATPSKYSKGFTPVFEVLQSCKSYQDTATSIGDVLLNCFLLAETSIQADTSLEAIHASKDIKMDSCKAKDFLRDLVKEITTETGAQFQKTVTPLDMCLDTALQVAITSLGMVVDRCKDIKQHSMTHV